MNFIFKYLFSILLRKTLCFKNLKNWVIFINDIFTDTDKKIDLDFTRVYDKNNYDLRLEDDSLDDVDNTDAITLAAYSIAKKSNAKAIITFSVSGRTTRRMARERAPVQIVWLSPNINTTRKMQLYWGVNSCYSDENAQNAQEMVKIACTIVKNKKLVEAGDNVVISAGVPFGNAGTTNLLRLAEIIADKDLT